MSISQELYTDAVSVMPGGVNSPVRAFGAVGGTPVFIERAKGSRIYDVDGREYIDYVCSWGPGILGHAREEVITAVQDACKGGLTFGAPTKKEVELAKLITECMPQVEKVRLVNSGTEAVMSAIRVARGYTGRDKIIKFRGCYHGHSDGLLVKAGSALLTGGIPDSAGVPKDYTKNTLVAEFNNTDSVEEYFKKCGKEIAAVIVEPVAANMGVVLPQDGFLEFLREITKDYGALLIYDEVITGFRLGINGAGAFYPDVQADLTTLGKIAGGGMPLAAYGGKKEIMDMVAPVGSVYQAGTLSGNPIATAAGIKTLEILKAHPEYYRQIEEMTGELADGIQDIMGEKVTVNQIGSLMSVFFHEKPVDNYKSAAASDTKMYAKYFHHMLANGIYLAPAQFEAMFISVEHTKEDIEKTLTAVERMKGK